MDFLLTGKKYTTASASQANPGEFFGLALSAEIEKRQITIEDAGRRIIG